MAEQAESSETAEEPESTETAEEPESAGGAAKQEVRNLRHEMSRERLDERAENAVESAPILRYLLEWKVVGIAVAIAAVLTLIAVLLMSPRMGAFVLVLSFAAAWAILGLRQYERRRPTQPAGESDG